MKKGKKKKKEKPKKKNKNKINPKRERSPWKNKVWIGQSACKHSQTQSQSKLEIQRKITMHYKSLFPY